MPSSTQEQLSTRQLEIAGLVARGKSTREIADALTLSTRTVENHIAAIFNKMGVSSRAELIAKLLTSAEPSDAGRSTGPARTTRTNVPLPRTALIGRDADIRELQAILADHRVASVIGSGGVGKTRIALALGEAVLASSSTAVWFVDLAPLTQGSYVTATIAQTVGIRESPTRPIFDSLVDYLDRRDVLLILDNCEHVIADVAAVAHALLSGSAHVRILTTSREALRIAGEQTYRLPSLDTPTVAQSSALPATEALTFSAIALFVERAKTADRGFRLLDENVALVAEICRRLDGIALAIELAAARVNILPLHALASKLDLLFRILTGGDRTSLPRHQTMRALIDWSYDLLTAAERRLFERLSIFAGGADLAAITVVFDVVDADEVTVLDLVSSLVDKSLVVVERQTAEPRYRLLESSRQYGAEKLATRGEAATVARLHAQAYAGLARRLERDYDAGADLAWLARTEPELENWRSALDWALGPHGDVVLGQRLAGTMAPIWANLSRVEGRRWVRQARALVTAQTPPHITADLDYAALQITRQLGEWEAALAGGLALIATYEQLGDPGKVARAQHIAGQSLVSLGQFEPAEELLRASLATARTLGNLRLVGLTLDGISMARSGLGDIDGARSYIAQALAVWREIGAQRNAAVATYILAEAEFRAGNRAQALGLTEVLIATFRELTFTPFLTPFFAQALINLAGYLIAADRWDEARRHAREALGHCREAQLAVALAWVLQRFAAIAALQSATLSAADATPALERAALLIGYVETSLTSLGAPREYTEQQEYERLLARLEAALAPPRLAELLARGAGLSLDAAIEIALAV